MTIHVIHERKTYVGKVVYNFNQVANMVLLVFDKPIYEDNTHILVKFDEVSRSWIDEEGIYKQNPLLFGQILNQIKKPIQESKLT